MRIHDPAGHPPGPTECATWSVVRLLLAAALVLSLIPAGAAAAADPPPADDTERTRPDAPADPGEVLDELQKLVDRLGRLLEELPRYALPEITEDGDIIIRRKDDRKEKPPHPEEPGREGVIEL
jgi:hypothetical protein